MNKTIDFLGIEQHFYALHGAQHPQHVDVYTLFAAAYAGVKYEEVTDRMRKACKRILFGIAYSPQMHATLAMPKRETLDPLLSDEFKARFGGDNWYEGLHATLKRTGMVK